MLGGFGGRKSAASWQERSWEAVLDTGGLARIWVRVQTLGREYDEDHLATAGVRTEPQDSAAWTAAHSVLWEAPVGGGSGGGWGCLGRGGARCTCGGEGDAHNLGGDSRDEGAGFLEPIEGLEKLTGVVTLPGQSFDTPDDLVMQIAGGEGVQ